MISFDAELRALAARLDLPEPARSRTLLELRSDLEAMAAVLHADGRSEEEARGRALEVLLPGRAALAELGRVHRSRWTRLVDRFSMRGRHRLERALLVATALAALAGGAGALAGAGPAGFPSPWLPVVLGLFAFVATAGLAGLFRRYVAGGGGARARTGPSPLLPLGLAAVLVAVAGTVADAWSLAGRLATAPGPSSASILDWMRSDAALLALAVVTAIVAGVLRLLADVHDARVAAAEAAALGIPSNRKGRYT